MKPLRRGSKKPPHLQTGHGLATATRNHLSIVHGKLGRLPFNGLDKVKRPLRFNLPELYALGLEQKERPLQIDVRALGQRTFSRCATGASLVGKRR